MSNDELLNYISMFRKKVEQGKLVIFVGAGVSCNVDGMPSWNTLYACAKNMRAQCCDIYSVYPLKGAVKNSPQQAEATQTRASSACCGRKIRN